jgi:hypothetical protein
MTIAVPTSFYAQLEHEHRVLMLYEPSRAKHGAFYPLAAVLNIRWRIVPRVTRRAGAARGARVREREGAVRVYAGMESSRTLQPRNRPSGCLADA